MSDTHPFCPSAGARLIDVISVQSQVAYGNVGNTIAVQVLQACGLQVAALPTVVLGNTPHYPTMHGGALPQDWFEGILDDLAARQVASRAALVLTGYLGSPAQGLALARWLDRVREHHPALSSQIDPVIGDRDTGVYTDPALIPVWRDVLAPRAQGMTPNHFELEQLVGRTLPTLDACAEAAASLLGKRTGWVAVTSAAPDDCPAGRLQVLLVTREGSERFEHAQVDHAVKGTGDLFGALIAGRRARGVALRDAIRRACDDTVAVLHHGQKQGWQELALPSAIAHRLAE
jgi:pyridoxine kinase